MYKVIETELGADPYTIICTYYKEVIGSFSYNAPSDMDYYGYIEVEYDLFDADGKYVNEISSNLHRKIKEIIIENMEE